MLAFFISGIVFLLELKSFEPQRRRVYICY